VGVGEYGMTETITAAEYKKQINKRPKYRNQITVFDGEVFHSRKEAQRSQELVLLAMTGHIEDLCRQWAFDLRVNGKLICKYIADFTYKENGVVIVEDVKSPATRKLPAYRIKFKLMQAIHGITIREV
jgi:uncharacterized protein DUF1064